MTEKERIRMGVSSDDEFDLDFINGKVADVHDLVIGKHHVCGGFITKTPTSRGNKYVLVCGKCSLRVEIPQDTQTKEDLINLLCQQGFHRKGEEVKVCLDCEGRGQVRQTEFKTEEEWNNKGLVKRKKEITITVDCPQCQSTGVVA